jgi:hypothetical protein
VGGAVFEVAGILGIGIAFEAFVLMVANGAREGRRFCGRVLRYLERTSCCRYLVHQPIALRQLGVTLLGLGASLALTALS